jgi:hypothetical protein
MKILIDGQTLLTPEINRGIGKYFVNSIENMLQYDFTNDFYLNAPPGTNLTVLSQWARQKLYVVENEAYGPQSEQVYSDTLNNDIERLGINVYWTPNALMHSVVLPQRQSRDCTYAATIFDLIVLIMEQEFAKHWPADSLVPYKKKLERLARDKVRLSKGAPGSKQAARRYASGCREFVSASAVSAYAGGKRVRDLSRRLRPAEEYGPGDRSFREAAREAWNRRKNSLHTTLHCLQL